MFNIINKPIKMVIHQNLPNGFSIYSILINQVTILMFTIRNAHFIVGKIGFVEFLMAIDLFEKGNLNEKLRYAFQLFDFDRNGVLTRSEILRMIKMILSLRGETANEQLKNAIISHLNAFFKYFDVNNDNVISLEEFCTICERDELLRNFLSPTFST